MSRYGDLGRKLTDEYLATEEPVPTFVLEDWLVKSEHSLHWLETIPEYSNLDPEVYKRLILALREVILSRVPKALD